MNWAPFDAIKNTQFEKIIWYMRYRGLVKAQVGPNVELERYR